ncbi:MAG: hypothetical protein U5R46_19925 [Gammaproteobacteria bacterium]|nr:hypothetical protein [Gammaproteobacteria bacterium]
MNRHTDHSSYREKLIEHLFIGELLKLSWMNGDCELEVASPEVDNSGYDVIAELRGIVRHIQRKASYVGGKTATQKVHVRLGRKPSGCVIWVYFNENTLELGPFLFFGGGPGETLPDIHSAKVARHTKGDESGYRAERPNIRVINKGAFHKYDTIKGLYGALFGTTA